MWNPLHPLPAPPAFGEDKVVPEEKANFLSRLALAWIDPFLRVGFSRPLQKEDFWELPKSRHTDHITDTLERNFYARCPPEKRPRFMAASSDQEQRYPDSPDVAQTRRASAIVSRDDIHKKDGLASPHIQTTSYEGQKETSASNEKDPGTGMETMDDEHHDSSLLKALHTIFFGPFWIAGVLNLIADTLKTTTPLVSKVLLTWLSESYAYHHLGPVEAEALGLPKPRGIGYGIGVAFAIFAMQEISSLITNHSTLIGMTVGMRIRTCVIGAIFRKSLRLSGRARIEYGVGRITTMISADASRLDHATAFVHNLWIAPIQLIIGIGLLLGNLGYSALVGLGVLILGFPIQFILVKILYDQRQKGVVITDQRVRLTTEILQGIRLIKYYAWEAFYAHRIGDLREKEMYHIRKLAFALAMLIAMVTFTPVLASILSFITYALSGHELNVATIFTSLQLFNLIRTPLIFLPAVIASSTDGAVALKRIVGFLMADELDKNYTTDPENAYAIDVDGDFKWEMGHKALAEAKEKEKDTEKPGESIPDPPSRGKKEKSRKNTRNSSEGLSNTSETSQAVLPTSIQDTSEDKKGENERQESVDDQPFELSSLKIQISRGSFVAVVGKVGSGKSSLLQALIGEMRRTRGHCVFSDAVAYVPQTAWIMNGTLRENITFGQMVDEDRLQAVIKACCLEQDLEMLPQGEWTEIGEKGINLSGGQKIRVSIARAAYSSAPIVLLDDSLSAVDAYVGRAILENCLLSGPLAGRTRVLVTHSLNVLDKVDYVYVMDQGKVTEQGTSEELMNDSGLFSRLMEESGAFEKGQAGVHSVVEPHLRTDTINEPSKILTKVPENGPGLMQEEERLTGAVSSTIYLKYFRHAGGVLWALVILLLLLVLQGAQVSNSLFLGFWTAESIHGFSQSDYMAVYGGLGVATAFFSFCLSFAISLASIGASLSLFRTAFMAILRSPVAFFDTTPMGRVISRLSKDQNTLDSEMSAVAFALLSLGSSVLGTVVLVFYTFPYLGIIFVPLSILYYLVALYYRRSSVETKRLDSLLRSALYASYSETLTGLSTIRAYAAQSRFMHNAETGLDWENRAYYMTISIQRWLSVRLDLFSNILVLGVGLFAAGLRNSVNPAKIGVVLSYSLGITQVFSELVSMYAQNEQNFNAVERILHYSELSSEGATTTTNDPPQQWPDAGRIEFKNVEMAYREGLPLVLRGVSFEVNSGEKIGIVGRTGAGKSSLLQALFRIANIKSGTISIDGVDISKIGLNIIRGRLSLVPQDSTLFLGTIRENLDPQATRTDAEIIEALKRTWLIPRDGSVDCIAEAKFDLNAAVSDEGSNYSAGEKQLLALCRALLKNSRIIVLDEATSSVDVETDAKVQKTIQTEFASSTLLCIAHRLNTIVYYDRILVMDAGRVIEFDTPLNLFEKEDSVFRSLCDEAGLTRQDIVRIRVGASGDP